MTPLEIRNSALKLYVSNGILLVTSVFAFCPQKSLMTGILGRTKTAALPILR